jgi:outer membrane protein TolC
MTWTFAFLALWTVAFAQTQPAGMAGQSPSGQSVLPSPSQTVVVQSTLTGPPITLTLHDALERAGRYSQQVYSVQFAAQLAHEDSVQARAALLPSATGFSQFIYTQPNGAPSGIFVSNDGPHVYNEQALVHGEIYNPAKLAERRRLIAAEAVAHAKVDLARRGLLATVTQNYYITVVAQRKIENAQASLAEAQQFLDITRKQEEGGEAAHVDLVKAQIQVQQRQRDLLDAQANYEKARIGFAVLLFADYGQAYTLADDLENAPPLPPLSELQSTVSQSSPDLRLANAAVEQQTHAMAVARAGLLPSLSFDYFYGINSDQFALHNVYGQNQLGTVAQAQLTVPVWNWGATRSRIKQTQIQLDQARADLSLARRTLMSEIGSFYVEAQTAGAQLNSLKSTVELSMVNLQATRLRYTAGESAAQEVVDAQSQLVTARNAYDDGLVRYRLAIANLQTLTGVF